MPAELFDRSHEVWQSGLATDEWAEFHGLTLRLNAVGPLSRHRDAVNAWALSAGISRFYGSSARALPDNDRLIELGLPSTNTVAEVRQRLHGVPIDWEKEARPERQRLR